MSQLEHAYKKAFIKLVEIRIPEIVEAISNLAKAIKDTERKL